MTTSAKVGLPGVARQPNEIEAISKAAELVEVAHRALREALEPGVTEIDLWTCASSAVARAGGDPELAEVDLMTGARTALIDAAPGKRRVRSGEPVLFDLAPCLDGYWADSCATVVCGEAPTRLVKRHAAIASALEAGLDSARPGVAVGDVDAAIRERLAEHGLACPHHTGHGVGAAPQEPPWFVPGNDVPLEAGVVIALEPGAYSGGFGVRLEHLAVVELFGARALTQHSLTLT